MLAQAFRLPEEFGAFKGAMQARIPLAVAATIKDPSDADYLGEMAGLYRAVQRLEDDQHFSKEQLKDLEAQRNQTVAGIRTGGFGAVNFTDPWGPGTIAQFLAGLTSPFVDAPFNTDHALKAVEDNTGTFHKQALSIEVPVVQGLITAGAIQPPKDATWFKNGTIFPDANFVEWVSGHTEISYSGKTLSQWIRSAQVAVRMQQSREP